MGESNSSQPWSARYAARTPTRPPLPPVVVAPGHVPVEQDDRLIGAVVAATTPAAADPTAPIKPAKIDWHSTAQVELLSTAEREHAQHEVEAQRRREAWRLLALLGSAVGAVLLVVLGYTLVQALFNARPGEARLAEVGAAVGADLLRMHASAAQPLDFGGSRVLWPGEGAGDRATVELEVTLRLRAPLFAPADTNGAQAYLSLQRSVQEAEGRLVQARLYLAQPELSSPPTLPTLLTRTHRAGERLIFRVPLDARRRLWGWQMEARVAQARRLGEGFTGTVAALQPAPALVLGQPETRDELRARQDAARNYVLAVQRALASARAAGGRAGGAPR